jgi:hypothetical protein
MLLTLSFLPSPLGSCPHSKLQLLLLLLLLNLPNQCRKSNKLRCPLPTPLALNLEQMPASIAAAALLLDMVLPNRNVFSCSRLTLLLSLTLGQLPAACHHHVIRSLPAARTATHNGLHNLKALHHLHWYVTAACNM